jgi:hypothetical protein
MFPDFHASSALSTLKVQITMSFIEKIASPAYYKGKVNAFAASTSAYYKPLFRAGR